MYLDRGPIVDPLGHVYWRSALLKQFGDPKGKIERLASIKTGIAHGLVTGVEIGVEDLLGSAKTFSDVVACEFDVDATWPRALGAVSSKEACDFRQDCVEMSGLATTRRRERIAVHGVAGPGHRVTRIAHCGEKGRKGRSDGLGAHATYEREAARDAIGIESIAESDNFVRRY